MDRTASEIGYPDRNQIEKVLSGIFTTQIGYLEAAAPIGYQRRYLGAPTPRAQTHRRDCQNAGVDNVSGPFKRGHSAGTKRVATMGKIARARMASNGFHDF